MSALWDDLGSDGTALTGPDGGGSSVPDHLLLTGAETWSPADQVGLVGVHDAPALGPDDDVLEVGLGDERVDLPGELVDVTGAADE
ncbi:hypothetical protein [Nocardioides ungokensis]|uniref:hypothetical protein n=1 Tax=Nocardioides ungokensis TaxID=1643322 RepID=UPI0015DF97EF|nr:hypothetical protein [Nocardioides ungokensis]